MKKLFLVILGFIMNMAFFQEGNAALKVYNYTGIQHNIWLSDGSSYGVSATTGLTVFAGPTAAGNIWARTHCGIASSGGGAPEMLMVYESGFGPSFVTTVATYPPMTGPYSVQYAETGGDVILTFLP